MTQDKKIELQRLIAEKEYAHDKATHELNFLYDLLSEIEKMEEETSNLKEQVNDFRQTISYSELMGA